MNIKGKMAHAANVTKWKADQQVRILKTQNLIQSLEGQIRQQKAVLADKALALYSSGTLKDDELRQICAAIGDVHAQVAAAQKDLEEIKHERPPELSAFSSAMPGDSAASTDPIAKVASSPPPSGTASGLICPECKRPLLGRFCPIHGKEGVAATPAGIQSPESKD